MVGVRLLGRAGDGAKQSPFDFGVSFFSSRSGAARNVNESLAPPEGIIEMARGYAAFGDVQRLRDGTDLNAVWAEFNAALDVANEARGALIDLLAFRTTNRSDVVLQSPSGTAEFEDASEYGQPSALRAEAATVELGYDFRWKDLATRYTWQYLADATASQVESLHAAAIASDSRLMHRTVLGALFDNTTRTHSSTDAPIRPLWNGDGSAIPEHDGTSFDPAHSHFATTDSLTLPPADVEWMAETVLEHGYGDNGAQLVLLCSREHADDIAGWRAGVNGAKFDYISSDASVPYLTTEQLVGQRPTGNFQGMKIAGQYGHTLIAPTSLVPRGYLACVAVGGTTPVVGMREHPTRTGLQIITGRSDYPLVDSFYVHGIGAGIRQRGGASVLQVTTSPVYTPPTL